MLIFFIKKIFTDVELIYNAAIISMVQQSDPVIHIHTSILFQILYPYRLSQIFFFLPHPQHMEVPVESELQLLPTPKLWSSAGSVTPCARLGIELAAPQRQAISLTHCATAGTPITEY